MSTSTDSLHSTDVLKAQASEAVRTVSNTLSDQANALRDVTTATRYSVQEYIENHPWRSVTIAACLGIFVGMIIGRR